MKALNKENYEAWVLEAFNFNEVRKDYNIPKDKRFYWDAKGSAWPGFDELAVEDGTYRTFNGINDVGVYIMEPWRYKEKGRIQKKKKIDKVVLFPIAPGFNGRLLKFVPENIPDLQIEAEEWIGYMADIDLKTWLESD